MKIHYIYKITNLKPSDSRKYYIGVRSTNCKTPEEDWKYMGSSDYLNTEIQKFGIDSFSKEILSVWKTRELANLEEIRLHALLNVSNNPEFYNLSNATSMGFCTLGLVPVIDLRDGVSKSVTKDEFKNNEYYQAVSKGKVLVLDIRDNKFKKSFYHRIQHL